MRAKTQHPLYVGCYAAADQPGIHAFDFDAATGKLTARGSFTGLTNPSFLVVHPNKRWLYAVSETSLESDGRCGAVWAFQINGLSLTLQPINQQSTAGDWPCHLQIDASGRWLFASNYGTGNVAVFSILEDGALGEVSEFVQHHGRGPHLARQEGPHSHSTTLSPDNRFVIVADLGIDQLVIYAFDGEAGKLRPHSSVPARAGAGPRHMIFSPDGRKLYVANELDSTITAYDYDKENGALREFQCLDTLPPEAPENTAADIHMSHSGRRLYVSNRGHNSIASFGVQEDGQLALLDISSCGGNWPRNFAVAPGEGFMLVGNRFSNEVSVLPMPANEGELGAPVTSAVVAQPACVRFVLQ